MDTATITRRQRTATPDRWQAALKRALAEGIEVRQLAGSGMWVATSGTDRAAAYEVIQFGCCCPAGEFGDPVCKHRAAYWHRLGVPGVDDGPGPPGWAAPARPIPALPRCEFCKGRGWTYREWATAGIHHTCEMCRGSGLRPAPALAVATAARAGAPIERMAALDPDEPAELLAA